MVFPTSSPHACRVDRVRDIREKFVDVAVGLVSRTIPILVPAGYSRYQAGTGQLFADPPLVNLMPLSLAVLAAATAARTAGRSRRAGMARSAGIVLGAGVGSVVLGLLAAALLPAAAFYDLEPTIATGLVVCALAVSGGWALGRLGWAEPGASVPALRRLSQRSWVRLPLVGVAVGAYLAVFAVLLYLGGVNGMVGGWLWSSAVLGGAGLLAWAALRPLPRARPVVTVITVVVGTGIGCVMAASSEMSPDRLASAMERVVPTTWSLEDEERTLNPLCFFTCSSASRSYLAPGDPGSVRRQTITRLRRAGYRPRTGSGIGLDEEVDPGKGFAARRGRVLLSGRVSNDESCSVDTGDSRFPPPPGQVCVQLSAETH